MRIRRTGFSLIEIVLVIGVIVLLIGLVVPGYSKARRVAATAQCESNLRQWGIATLIYAQENDCFLPRRGQGAQPTAKVDRAEDWFNALPPLLGMPSYFDLSERKEIPRPGAKGLWMCPAATPSDGIFYFAYGMNMRLSVWSAERPDQIDRVAPTDRQVFLADGPGAYCSVLPSVQPFSPTARHENAVNIAFLDGHVSRFAGDYIGCGKGDPRRPDVRWLVPGSAWTGPHE